jgi:2-polyprenyl-3-methyl-5-hydroxy-6-metoxy-1,4-benzoquinol methylase
MHCASPTDDERSLPLMSEWTNEAAIRRWGAMPRAVVEKMDPDGDFAKRHLLNPVLLRLLGDVRGRRVLDAGCGQGYFSRMLADRDALVVGVEPGQSLFKYAQEKAVERRQGIRYVQADLSRLPDLGPPFDLCVANGAPRDPRLGDCDAKLRRGPGAWWTLRD